MKEEEVPCAVISARQAEAKYALLQAEVQRKHAEELARHSKHQAWLTTELEASKNKRKELEAELVEVKTDLHVQLKRANEEIEALCRRNGEHVLRAKLQTAEREVAELREEREALKAVLTDASAFSKMRTIMELQDQVRQAHQERQEALAEAAAAVTSSGGGARSHGPDRSISLGPQSPLQTSPPPKRWQGGQQGDEGQQGSDWGGGHHLAQGPAGSVDGEEEGSVRERVARLSTLLLQAQTDAQAEAAWEAKHSLTRSARALAEAEARAAGLEAQLEAARSEAAAATERAVAAEAALQQLEARCQSLKATVERMHQITRKQAVLMVGSPVKQRSPATKADVVAVTITGAGGHPNEGAPQSRPRPLAAPKAGQEKGEGSAAGPLDHPLAASPPCDKMHLMSSSRLTAPPNPRTSSGDSPDGRPPAGQSSPPVMLEMATIRPSRSSSAGAATGGGERGEEGDEVAAAELRARLQAAQEAPALGGQGNNTKLKNVLAAWARSPKMDAYKAALAEANAGEGEAWEEEEGRGASPLPSPLVPPRADVRPPAALRGADT